MPAVLSVWFHRRMAMLATLFGRSEVALAHWRAVCRLRPCDAMAVATVGHRAVCRLRPCDAMAVATVGHLLAGQGRRDAAIAALEASLAIDANLAAVWFNLGFLQQERDDHEPALASFDRALALDARLDRAWYGKALSLIKLGRVDEAIPVLQRNTELQPMSPFGWYQLAHAYVRAGQPDRARGVIRRLFSSGITWWVRRLAMRVFSAWLCGRMVEECRLSWRCISVSSSMLTAEPCMKDRLTCRPPKAMA